VTESIKPVIFGVIGRYDTSLLLESGFVLQRRS